MSTIALSQLFDVEARTFLVTGAAGAVGSRIVPALLALGANVVSFDRAPPVGVPESDHHLHVVGEATSADDVAAALKRAVERFGAVHTLINGVGINRRGTVAALVVDEFRDVMDVNVVSALLFSRGFAALEASHPRAIINIASIAGRHGIAGAVAYCASKAAVISLTQVSAVEWAERGIRVNALSPAALRTPMMAERLNTPEKMAAMVARFPLGRLGEPDDLLGAIVFLASSAASWVTGQVITIDGGRTATN